MTAARIGVVGDFNSGRIAHNAIQRSFALGGHLYPGALEAEWLGTETIVPLVYRMPCSLIEQEQEVTATAQSFREIYGASSGMEGYHCSYGLNPDYEKLFEGTELHIVARAADGQARAFQLQGHPFFIGTQFQPERRAVAGSLHPVITAFFAAAMEWHTRSRKP